MAATAGIALSTVGAVFHQRINLRHVFCPLLQVREYAARKGTREKREKLKKKRKVEVKPVGLVAPHLRAKKLEKIPLTTLMNGDHFKSVTTDNVWLSKYHQWKIYPFAEAIECHRETHHPTGYDAPNAYVDAFIELNMTGVKETKPVEPFKRVVDIPWPFDHGEERTVVAFAKSREFQQTAEEAGATLVGGADLINKFQTGELSIADYGACVAHPEILPELSVIRGLLKKKNPMARGGTLGLDLAKMIKKVLHGIHYGAVLHERQPLFATITVPIGKLTMDADHLEENFRAIIQDVNTVRPKRDGPFIWRTCLKSLPSPEAFKINFEEYLADAKKTEEEDDESDDEEAAAA